MFIDIFFIMPSVWFNQFYYVFGFLFVVFVILIITCAEITIVLCYCQLCSEDYHWWWRAYLTPGTSALARGADGSSGQQHTHRAHKRVQQQGNVRNWASQTQ